ncbi:MAG: class I SAM-dependent methyltransferase [Bryobacteraceae bacterium]
MLRRTFAGALIAGAAAGFQYEESRGDAPWVPTPEEVVDTMLRAARVGPSDLVYDLGCGDGRIVIEAAKTFGARGVGVDIEPERIQEANEAARAAGVSDRVRFLVGDLFETPVAPASVVMLYLFTKMNARLKPRLLSELKPGSRVVTYQFNGMGDWKPRQVINKHSHPVYFFVVPPRRKP